MTYEHVAASSAHVGIGSISLNVMTLLPRCEKVETRFGVALTVTGVAQVAIISGNHMEGQTAENRTGAQKDQFMYKARHYL